MKLNIFVLEIDIHWPIIFLKLYLNSIFHSKLPVGSVPAKRLGWPAIFGIFAHTYMEKISTGFDGGLKGVSGMRRHGSEDPLRR